MYTLEQLNDLEQIRRLRCSYSAFYDSQRLRELCGLFTENAVCRWNARHGGTWRGLPEIRRNYLECFRMYPGYYTVLHTVTNHMVELTGADTAKGSCFLLDYNFLKTERPSPLGTVGVYYDHYVKENGVWKFCEISLDFLWPDREIVNRQAENS